MSEDSIAFWRRVARDLTIDDFADEFPFPFLVRKQPSGAPSRGPSGDFDDLAFKTGVVDLEPPPPLGRLGDSQILPIIKSDRNPFAGQISVGRAGNCDIILRDASVSKNHAYFKIIERTTAELVDTRSQNCTRVNARPIKPIVPVTVVTGDTIIFGTVLTQFLDPPALYRLISS